MKNICVKERRGKRRKMKYITVFFFDKYILDLKKLKSIGVDEGECKITTKRGYEYYLKNYKFHRKGKAAIIEDDEKEYWVNGKRHCLHGPAVIKKLSDFDNFYNGVRRLYRPGKLHRDDKCKRYDITGVSEFEHLYYIDGVKYEESDYKQESKKKLQEKYFKIWYNNCEAKGGVIFKINIMKELDAIEKLHENENFYIIKYYKE